MTKLLSQKTRVNTKHTPNPSYSLIDSQSVETIYACEQRRGFDGEKNQRPQTTHSD
jgi:hypothetical protein